MKVQITDLPVQKEITHKNIDHCFYVNINESGAPISRVELKTLLKKAFEAGKNYHMPDMTVVSLVKKACEADKTSVDFEQWIKTF